MSTPELTLVPKDLYYHEVAYVRDLEAKVKGLAVFDPAEVDDLRTMLIERRDNALKANDFGQAVELSHVIKTFSMLKEVLNAPV